MAVMKMAFPAEYIAGIMAPGLAAAAAAPAGMPAAGPAVVVPVDMSDGGEPPAAAAAVPGTRGTPYITAPPCYVSIIMLCNCYSMRVLCS